MRRKGNQKKMNSHLKQIFVSSAALLLILVLGIGVTFSWIEGGDTYTMKSENDKIKTAALPEDTKYHGTLNLQPGETDTSVDISAFDETTTSELTFSPVSSKDGENFYFPVKDSDGNVATYRKATTNDIGTKFIAYDFDVLAKENCYLMFAEQPTITIKNSNGVAVEGADVSPFRIMISSDNTGTLKTYVFSGDGSVQTSNVVIGLSPSKATTESFSTDKSADYVYAENDASKKKLFTFKTDDSDTESGTVNVSVWLDSGADVSKLSALKGCTATVSMKLMVVEMGYTIGINAVTYKQDGTKESNGFTGGTIKFGDETLTAKKTVNGKTVTLTAQPNEGYEFMGWFTEDTCLETFRVGTAKQTTLEYTATDNVQLYARFNKTSTTTIYFENRSDYEQHNAYVYQKYTDDRDTTHFNGSWPGNIITLDTETPYYKYVFTTSEVGKFNVIISSKGGSQYPGTNVEGLEGELGGTYFFPAGEPSALTPLTDSSFVTVKTSAVTDSAVSTTGGTAKVEGETTQKILPGGKLDLTATPKTGYKFVGWYTNSACTTTIGTDYTSVDPTVTVNAAAGSTVTYYAKFESYIKVVANSTPSGTGNATVNSTGSVQVKPGTTVNLVATPETHYNFVGWYTDSECTTTIGTNYTSATTTVTATGSPGATVNYYAKFVAKNYKITAYAVSDGTSNNSTLGGVKYTTSASYTASDNVTAAYDSTVTFNAQAKTGGVFVGWYTAATGGTKLSSELTYTHTITGATSIYARFETEQTTKTIYFKAAHWDIDGAQFGVHIWNGIDSSMNVMMTSVGDNVYKCEIDPKYTKIQFLRLNTTVTSADQIDYNSNVWNHSGDETIPTNGNNFYTISSGWTGATGTWSTY